ncbi:hypothetical protein ACJIZ3_001822 [Penstemon smallii]|uniref:F-box domain-containing protein n=1 Tax=Penstemon smallii TaxID=265156 RepID=A0ABD3U4N9_9LAMI
MNENQRSICAKSRRRAETLVSDFCILRLPTSILLEIFLRLPVKAVINCKIVCKVWYKIISEPYFINSYLKNPHFSTFLLPMYNREYPSVLQLVCLIEISRSGEFIRTIIEPKSSDFSQVVLASSAIGSCNGLLCTYLVKSRFEICISNPITGDCIALPKLNRPIDEKSSFYMFGFSPSTKNLKVVRIPSIKYIKRKCEIFTVGIDKNWRSMPNPLTPGSRWSGGIALNGISHWIFKETGSTSILTFDIEKEIFGRISHPPNLVLDLETMIVALNDKLCLIDYAVSSETTIWTMQEYAVVNSWSKCVISHIWFPSSVFSRSLAAVAILPNGDIIFSHDVDKYVIIYSPELHIWLESEDLDVRKSFTSRILPYTPMFTPLENAIAGEIDHFSYELLSNELELIIK